MDEKLFQRIKQMTELQGTSGSEDEVREVLAKEMDPYVDRVEYDGLGGVFGIRKSKAENAPRVMVAAHME